MGRIISLDFAWPRCLGTSKSNNLATWWFDWWFSIPRYNHWKEITQQNNSKFQELFQVTTKKQKHKTYVSYNYSIFIFIWQRFIGQKSKKPSTKQLPGPSKGCCLILKGWCSSGNPKHHPFSTPRKIRVGIFQISYNWKLMGPSLAITKPGHFVGGFPYNHYHLN